MPQWNPNGDCGVRPSSGAATYKSRKAVKIFNARALMETAAPEDGRTPPLSLRHYLAVLPGAHPDTATGAHDSDSCPLVCGAVKPARSESCAPPVRLLDAGSVEMRSKTDASKSPDCWGFLTLFGYWQSAIGYSGITPLRMSFKN